MAGSTTNIGLIKPTYSEDADVAIINENMDTLDSTISALDNGLAIVSNNNTHGAITAGQYVYVRNHGSLAEGMYTANSNIAANATLSSSNLTAVSSGSLNKLNSDITTLNGKLTTSSFTSINTNLGYIKNDYMVTFYVMNASPTTTETSIGLLPSEIAPKTELRYGGICGAYGTKNMQIKIKSNGDVTVQADSSQVSGYGACTYVI